MELSKKRINVLPVICSCHNVLISGPQSRIPFVPSHHNHDGKGMETTVSWWGWEGEHWLEHWWRRLLWRRLVFPFGFIFSFLPLVFLHLASFILLMIPTVVATIGAISWLSFVNVGGGRSHWLKFGYWNLSRTGHLMPIHWICLSFGDTFTLYCCQSNFGHREICISSSASHLQAPRNGQEFILGFKQTSTISHLPGSWAATSSRWKSIFSRTG